MLDVSYVVGAKSVGVDIDVVVAEGVGKSGVEACAGGDEGIFGTGHNAFSKPRGSADCHGEASFERQFGVELYGAHFLGVETETDAGNGYGGDCFVRTGGLRMTRDGFVLPRGEAVDTVMATESDEFVPMATGFPVAASDKGVDGGGEEAGGAVAVDVHLDKYIAHGDIFLVFVFGVDVDNLCKDGGCVVDFVGVERVALDGDADDDVGAHLSGEVSGVVVAEASVNKHAVADTDWGEYTGDGHGGTHGLDEVTLVEVDFGIGDEVGGNAGKGDGQLGEVETVEVTIAELSEEPVEVAAADESSSLGTVVAEAADDGVGVLFFALAEGEVCGVGTVAEECSPILSADEGVKEVGAVAETVKSTDETSHAGAADDVDRDTGLFDDFEGTDVSHSLGTAPGEDDGDDWTVRLGFRRGD